MITIGQWAKWFRMLAGTSVQHALQGPGHFYAKDKIVGYYNDLRNKVHLTKELDNSGIPIHLLASGQRVYLPTAVAQYGLGAYDLYLETGEMVYRQKALTCAGWLVKNQDQRGGWDIWHRIGTYSPILYSAMTQGEGASLLFRAAMETGDTNYFKQAERALELMLLPLSLGGTSRMEQGRLYLEEYVGEPPNTILNGWVFAIFGLYDGVLATSRDDFRQSLSLTVGTLANELQHYDAEYWSYYDQRGCLASPFYHRLHLALLQICVDLFEVDQLKNYLLRWQGYQGKLINRSRAFAIKAWQKLREPGQVVIVK
ncbi:MAG: thioredoxin [Actinobacteria bacterium]|nr:thioredoxin [Actinomycetota bacterium]